MKRSSVAASTLAVIVTMACGSLPAYAASSSSSSGSTSTTSSTNGVSPGNAQTAPKLSQQDALAVVNKQFSQLVKNLNPPMVNLQPDPVTNGSSNYGIDWNMMASNNQAGPRLNRSYAHATVDANTGQVLQFQYTSSSWTETKTISLSAALAIAQKWVKQLAPNQASDLVLEDKKQLASGFVFLFVRQVNGIPAPFDSVRVQLGVDGGLQYYNFSWHKATFPALGTETVISKQDAQQTYQSDLTVALRYQEMYSPQGPLPMELVYQPVTSDASGNILSSPLPILDAHTGEQIGQSGTVVPAQPQAQTAETPIDPAGPTQFPQTLKTPLTKSEVTAQITKQLGLDGPDWSIQSVQQTRRGGNTLPDHLMWNLSFQNSKTQAGGSVEVDSTDGVIVSYNTFSQGSSQSSSSGSAAVLSKDQLQAAANAVVKKVYPNLTGAIAPAQTKGFYQSPNQTMFAYDFLVNGIPVHGFQVMLNPMTGAVQNLFLQTDPSTSFPSPDKAIPLKTAMSDVINADPLTLQYMLPEQPVSPDRPLPLTYGTTAKLVYAAAPLANGLGTLNAITGKWEQNPLLGNPSPVGSASSAKASPEQQAISTLEQHGVISSSDLGKNGTLDTSALISRGQFIAWLTRAYNFNISSSPSPQFSDVTSTTPYASELSEAIVQGWIHNSGPIHPGRSLTRAEAARLLVQWMGWQGPALHTGFFKVNFTDAGLLSKAYLGDAVMMSQSGALPLESGRFRPNQSLTVGQAALALTRTVQLYLSSNP